MSIFSDVVNSFPQRADSADSETESQWHFSPRAYAKLNTAFGVTSKATDFAPEVGVLFGF